MQLLTLHLNAFGPFTNTSLSFAADKLGLHIIYGPNEAGKSSALRSLSAFFYGFEQRTNDDFLHSNSKLKIGGMLLHSDGSRLEVWRRKGNKNTLLDVNGQVVDEQTLKRFLGDIDKNFFEVMFGLDHVRLRQGGQEILSGGGQVGQALFSAGTGIIGLHQLAISLQQEADVLFKPRGKNQHINSLNRQCAELRHTRNEQILRGADWQAHDTALSQAKERLAVINQKLQLYKIEQARLDRLQRALPDVAKRSELYATLAEINDTVLLPLDFTTRRVKAVEQLANAKRELEVVDFELARLDQELQELIVNRQLLELGPEIERISRQLGQVTKADEDLKRLQIVVRNQEAAAGEFLQAVRPDLTLDQAVSELHITKARQDEIRELSNQYSAINAHIKDAMVSQAAIQTKLNLQYQLLEQAGLAADTSNLRWICEQTQRAGNIEDRLAATSLTLNRVQAKAETGLRKLWGWNQDLEALELLPLPPLETVAVFQDAFSELDNRYKILIKQIDNDKSELAKADNQLAVLQLEGGVPDEQDLIQARNHRDFGWQLVCNSWLANQPDSTAERIFDSTQPLAKAYQHSVQDADAIADRLRRESTRVQQQARARADLIRYQKELGELQQELADTACQRVEREQAWSSLWQTLGVTHSSPKEMRIWLEQAEKLRLHKNNFYSK